MVGKNIFGQRRPMVTSYGRLKFCHIVYVPNQNHTVHRYSDPLCDSSNIMEGFFQIYSQAFVASCFVISEALSLHYDRVSVALSSHYRFVAVASSWHYRCIIVALSILFPKLAWCLMGLISGNLRALSGKQVGWFGLSGTRLKIDDISHVDSTCTDASERSEPSEPNGEPVWTAIHIRHAKLCT